MSTDIELTEPLERQILASIRSGGYVHVARAAWGVSSDVWEKWQRWGNGADARSPYKEFCRQVEQAKAQARLRAEMATLEDDPRTWLKHGPGKEQPGVPGWSALPRHVPAPDQPAFDLFASPNVLELLANLRAILAPFPDVLPAVTAAVVASLPHAR